MKLDHKTSASPDSPGINPQNVIHNHLPASGPGPDHGGEMDRRIRAFDWPQTPLGPSQAWSPALRTMVQIMLANRFPHLLWWGSEYITLYNDPYIPVLGEKHPKALGQPGSECWQEIWHILRPMVDTPFHGGPATWNEDLHLEMNRHGFIEETYFTFAYSPVPDETVQSGIGGVLATVHETTQKVIGERRIVALRDLGARVGDARTAEEACQIAAEILTAHSRDIPFALFYLVDEDGKHARLAGAAGVQANEGISPLLADLTGSEESGWPFTAAWQTKTLQVVDNLSGRFDVVPPGPWSDAPHEAVVVPIPSNKAHEPAGLLVAGISARLKFDQLYRDFIDLVRTQVATAIANARVYEEERRQVEALAEIDRAKTAFFANISHEFRTPLTLMMGPLEDSLSDPEGLSPANRERLELAHRNALRQLKLVNTLLDFSRIEAGRVQASYEPLDLAGYTTELASVFRSAIEHAGLKLIVDCPPLPEPVYVDREMWEKIVLNLLSNAFKFTFEGEIEVSLQYKGERVVFAVRDTGVGVPEHELPSMFERFHRVRASRSRTHEGTGIGLAFVQELVRLHGGSIEVASRENHGTTFTISLPTGTALLPADRIGAPRSLSSTALGAQPFVQEVLSWLPEDKRPDQDTQPDGLGALVDALPLPDKTPGNKVPAGGRILLVDDNSDMRRYLERLLVQDHFEVEPVADGLSALRAAREHTPDLVLTDVMMPGLDGFALLRELRADPATAGIPIIMLSARAGEEAQVEGMDAGADDYLTKPFGARELLARIRAHLEIARIRRESEKALQYRSAQYETLLNRAPIGVYLVDADLRIREVNPVAQAVFGEASRLIGRTFDEVIHRLWTKEYANEVVRLFRHTLETGEPYETPGRSEFRIDRHRSEHYEWRLDRIVLPEGTYGVVCYFRDISAQVQVQNRIAESEERYRGIVNQSVGAIVEADPSGRFTMVNDRFCDMTGYSREELLSLGMLALTHPEDLVRSRQQLEQLMAGGKAYEIEKRYIRRDGSVIWVHKSTTAVRGPDDSLQSLIAVLIDITHSKQTEADLQKLNLQLENLVLERTSELRLAIQSLREEIVGRIRVEKELNLNRDRLRALSRRLVEVQEQERRALARELHDRVGQGMTAVNLNLNILRDQLDPETLGRVGKRLEDCINLLEETIPAVRNLMSNLRPALLDEYGLITALGTYLKDFSSRYGIPVRFESSAVSVPRLESSIEITLLRIAQEALFNIVKHARASEVSLNLLMVDSMICLRVQDNGLGMDLNRPEAQAGSHGLTIMRERAEAVGGTLKVISEPGRGTTIEARIPAPSEAQLAAPSGSGK